MVFVTSIDDVQLCLVSIYMQGFPVACGLSQPGFGEGPEIFTAHVGQNGFQQAP